MGGCGQSSHWRILKISFPPLRLYGVCGAKICLKTTDPGLVSILTAQNYCNFSKLPTFYLLICVVFIPKAYFTPQSWSASTPWSCLSASLVMVITRFWWWKLPPSCRLLLVSSALFCPLLSYSLFFGKPSGCLRGSAPYYCCRTGYKLLQERFPAILSRHGKTRASSVSRMAYRKRCYTLYLLFLLFSLLSRLHRNNTNTPDTLFFGWTIFPFFMRSFFDWLPLVFLFNMRFCEKDILKSWWNLDFDAALS